MAKLASVPVTLDIGMRGQTIATLDIDVPVNVTATTIDGGAELKIDFDRLKADIQRIASAALAAGDAGDHEADRITITKSGVQIEGQRIPVYLAPSVKVEQVADDLALVHLGVYAKTVSVEGLPVRTDFEYVDSRSKGH